MTWRDFFDRAADTHGASPRTSRYADLRSFAFHRDAILAWIGPMERQRILDAGCGGGAVVEPLIARNDVYGVDFSGHSLVFAKARGVWSVCADLEALPLAAGRFDLVLCIGVLQHVRVIEPTIRSLADALRPGGTLVVMTINGESLVHRALARARTGTASLQRHTVADVAATFARCDIAAGDRLHLYYPLRLSTTSAASTWSARHLSTSFAIRGVRCGT
jgi:2-polyprenyl-3-methyl-5-hydroxy-6-metoxy-1,4-benzoquinol methylase